MNPRRTYSLRPWLAAAIGFLFAAMATRFIAGAIFGKSYVFISPWHAAARASTPTPLATIPPKAGPPAVFPRPGILDSLAPVENYRLSQQLASVGATDPAQRAQWLAEAMLREEPERQMLLRRLLSGWASTDPKAAAEWVLTELGDIQGGPGRLCLYHIAVTWAASDGLALARWANQAELGKKADLGAMEVDIGRVLFDCDPLAWAQFLEMPCNSTYRIRDYGDSEVMSDRLLASSGFVLKMVSAVRGQVAYNSGNLQLNLEHEDSARHPKQKEGWNILFEQTATTYHRLDPAACDAWLATFPENAQTAARHFISKDQKAPDKTAEPALPTTPQAPLPPVPPLVAR